MKKPKVLNEELLLNSLKSLGIATLRITAEVPVGRLGGPWARWKGLNLHVKSDAIAPLTEFLDDLAKWVENRATAPGTRLKFGRVSKVGKRGHRIGDDPRALPLWVPPPMPRRPEFR